MKCVLLISADSGHKIIVITVVYLAQGSVVIIVTCYRLDGPGIESH